VNASIIALLKSVDFIRSVSSKIERNFLYLGWNTYSIPSNMWFIFSSENRGSAIFNKRLISAVSSASNLNLKKNYCNSFVFIWKPNLYFGIASEFSFWFSSKLVLTITAR
jgi:hypothetical protein